MENQNEFFHLEVDENIAVLYLNKPEKRNSMDLSFWSGLSSIVETINKNQDIRAFILSGKGKSFSTGLEISEFADTYKDILLGDTAEKRKKLLEVITAMQNAIKSIYYSNKPSIACVHKHCIGGGLDLISACDIRYCSKDAVFSLREAKVAIVADMGSLNLLPSIIGQGYTRELALTGRDIRADEAMRIGLVNQIFETKEECLEYAKSVALEIGANSPIVIEGIKDVLRYCQNKPLEDGLKYVAVWNSSFLTSEDFKNILYKYKKNSTNRGCKI